MIGHRIAQSLALVLAVLIATQAAAQGQGQDREKKDKSDSLRGLSATLSLPVGGSTSGTPPGTFQGTLHVQRFVARGAQIVAVAMISGTAVAADGTIVGTVLNGPIEVPVMVSQASGESRSGALRPDDIILAQATSCGILHLAFGEITLNVLGLVVTTSPITLDLTGETGGTNLLGTAVCGVLGALTGAVGTVVGLLNTLLGLLSGLTGGLAGGLTL